MSRTEQRRCVSKDDVRNNARESGGGKKYFKLPPGVDLWVPDKAQSYDLDFWPYPISIDNHPDRRGDKMVKGDLWYKLPFITHRDIGPAREEVVCPTTFGLPCPICEERARLAKDYNTNEAEIKLIKSIRNAAYIITDPRDNDRFAVFAYSTFKFGEQLDKEIKDGNEDNIFFWDTTEDGRTMRVRFGEEKFEGNGFFKANRFDFSPRGKYDEDTILKAVPNLDAILLVHPYEELRKLFLQVDDGKGAPGATGGGGGGATQSRPKAGNGAQGGGAGPGGARRAPGGAAPTAAPTGKGEAPTSPAPTEGDDEGGGIVEGAAVTFDYKGKTLTGTVTDVDGDNVEIASGDKSYDVKISTVKLASAGDDEDDQDESAAPKASAKKGPGAAGTSGAAHAPAPKKGAPKGATPEPAAPDIVKGMRVIDDEGNVGVVTKVKDTDVTFKPEDGGPALTVDKDDVKPYTEPAGEAQEAAEGAGDGITELKGIKVGDTVAFENDGEKLTGTVAEIRPNEDIVIDASDGEQYTLDVDEVSPVEGGADDDEDAPLAPGDKVTWDDGDEEGRVVKVKEDRVKVSNEKGESWQPAAEVKRKK